MQPTETKRAYCVRNLSDCMPAAEPSLTGIGIALGIFSDALYFPYDLVDRMAEQSSILVYAGGTA